MNPLKTLVFLAVLCSFASVGFAADCSLAADYTQTGDDTCDNLYTNGYTWDTAGFGLTVAGLVDINGAGGIVQGRTGDHQFGSLEIESGNTYNATNGTTFIDKRDGVTLRVVDVNSGGTLNHSNGKFHFIQNLGRGDILCSGESFYDVEFGQSEIRSYRFRDDCTIDNDMTVTSVSNTNGVYFLSGVNLTVTGDVTLNDLLTGGNGNHSFGSLTINSGGIYNATSGTTIINSNRGVDNWGLDVNAGGTFTHNNGLLKMTKPTGSQYVTGYGTLYDLDVDKATGRIYLAGGTIANDVTITSGGLTGYTGSDIWTISGDLSIAAGGTLFPGTMNVYTLTVIGDVNISGTFTGRQGICSFGSLTINSGGTYSATSGTTTITSETAGGFGIFNDGGTLIHNDGIITITTGTQTSLDWGSGTGEPYDLIINSGNIVGIKGNPWSIAHDVTVTDGTLRPSSTITTGTISGAVNVSGTFGHLGKAGGWSFGSLIINSGGTYIALSGTTTINGNIHNDGTFTHNDGTVDWNSSVSGDSISGSVPLVFYNLNLTGSGQLRQYVNVTVRNNFTITAGMWRSYNFWAYLYLGYEGGAPGSIYCKAASTCIVPGAGGVQRVVGLGSTMTPWTGYDAYFGSGGGKWLYPDNIDFQVPVETGGWPSPSGYVLQGNNTFSRGFILSPGDTLDLNGYNITFTSLTALEYDEDVNFDGNFIHSHGTVVVWSSLTSGHIQVFAGGSAFYRLVHDGTANRLQLYEDATVIDLIDNAGGGQVRIYTPTLTLGNTTHAATVVGNGIQFTGNDFVTVQAASENYYAKMLSDVYIGKPKTTGFTYFKWLNWSAQKASAHVSGVAIALAGDVIFADWTGDSFRVNTNDVFTTNGYNMKVGEWQINGEANITDNSEITFYDSPYSGFGDSTGNLTVSGRPWSIVLQSENSPPANLWTINASTFASLSVWEYVDVSYGNSVGPENVSVMGYNLVGNTGYWNFTLPPGEPPLGTAIAISAPGFDKTMVLAIFILAGCLFLLKRK